MMAPTSGIHQLIRRRESDSHDSSAVTIQPPAYTHAPTVPHTLPCAEFVNSPSTPATCIQVSANAVKSMSCGTALITVIRP